MPKRLLYLLLAVSLGINVGVIATTIVHQAKMPPGPHPSPGGGPGPDSVADPAALVDEHVRGITRHLGLDPEQQEAIRAAVERQAPLLVQYQAEVSRTSRQLSDAFASPDFDPEGFRQLVAAASVVRSRLDSLSAVTLVAEAAVLTPEQRQKFALVAPTIHSRPQTPREGGPPPRAGNRRPPDGGPPPR